MIGRTFERLTVVEVALKGLKGHKQWLCKCSCGEDKIIRDNHLISGFVRSCGCLQKELQSMRTTTHGMSKSKTHISWTSMKSRCYNPNVKAYNRYGGRGIIVCDRWLHSFENFIADMGEKPPKCAIDRINNNGNYEPSNCRWVSYSENNRNKRNSVILTFNGVSKSISDWADDLNINHGTLVSRLKRNNWGIERILTETPFIGKNQFSENSS